LTNRVFKIQEVYTDEAIGLGSPTTLNEIMKKHPEVLRKHSGLVYPFVYVGKFDESEKCGELFSSIWDSLTGSNVM
jgi:hypothetical protein